MKAADGEKQVPRIGKRELCHDKGSTMWGAGRDIREVREHPPEATHGTAVLLVLVCVLSP